MKKSKSLKIVCITTNAKSRIMKWNCKIISWIFNCFQSTWTDWNITTHFLFIVCYILRIISPKCSFLFGHVCGNEIHPHKEEQTHVMDRNNNTVEILQVNFNTRRMLTQLIRSYNIIFLYKVFISVMWSY